MSLRVVIVGASCSPLGTMLIDHHAEKEHSIVIVERKKSKKSAVGLLSKSENSTLITGEITTEAGWEKIINSVIKKIEGIDVLYYMDHKKSKNTFGEGLEELKEMVERNFFAPIYAMKHALPHLRKTNAVVVVFPDSEIQYRHSTFYTSSKRAMRGFFTALATEENSLNILMSTLDIHSSDKDQVQKKYKKIFQFILDNTIISNRESRGLKLSTPRVNKRLSRCPKLKASVEIEPEPLPFDDENANLISKAIITQNKNLVKEILTTMRPNSSTLFETDSEGRTALHYCAHIGNLQILEQIIPKLRSKTMLNEQDNYKYTPLHVAAKNGHLSMVKRLIKEGADPFALCLGNYSIIHFIARLSPDPQNQKATQSLLNTLKYLMELGVEPNQRNSEWFTPLHEAVKFSSLVVVKFLLDNEGNVNRKSRTGYVTPLHFAVLKGDAHIIETLLKAGADPSAVSLNYGSSFDIATPEIYELLEDYRDKNRREEASDAFRTYQTFIITSFDDFDSRDLKMIKQSGLDNLEIFKPDNWRAFSASLSFLTKKIYKTPQEHASKGFLPKKIASKSGLDITLEQAYENFITPGNPRKLFKVLSEAGKGGFGRVFVAKRLEDKKIIAIKKVSHISEKEQWSNYDEINFMKKSECANVVKYFNCYYSRDELWMIMEYLEGGSLSQAIPNFKIDERQICFITKCILKGLKKIHSKRFIHRDLKSANIMLSVRGDVKIIDFGLCIDLSTTPNPKSMVGSPYWIPPEMILKQEHDFTADTWSLAILMIEMANGGKIKKSALRAMYNTGTGVFPEFDDPSRWSKEFKTFIGRMLVFNPKERATPDELLKDPWLQTAVSRRDIIGVLETVFIEQSLSSLLM